MNITFTKTQYPALGRALAALVAASVLVAALAGAYELGHREGARQLDRLDNAYTRCGETGGRWQEGPEHFQCLAREVEP